MSPREKKEATSGQSEESGNSSGKNIECGQSSRPDFLFEEMREKIVIICTNEDNSVFSRTFTGFYVGDGCILTSGMFLQKANSVYVIGHDYDKDVNVLAKPVQCVVADGWLGILHMETKGNPCARISHDTTIPLVGRSVYSISHPWFQYFSFMRGHVVSPLKTLSLDQTDCTAHVGLQVMQLRGLSGGVVNNEDDEDDKDSLGAPVFDNNGDVLGMIIDCDDTKDPPENEQPLGEVNDWIRFYHLDTVDVIN